MVYGHLPYRLPTWFTAVVPGIVFVMHTLAPPRPSESEILGREPPHTPVIRPPGGYDGTGVYWLQRARLLLNLQPWEARF